MNTPFDDHVLCNEAGLSRLMDYRERIELLGHQFQQLEEAMQQKEYEGERLQAQLQNLDVFKLKFKEAAKEKNRLCYKLSSMRVVHKKQLMDLDQQQADQLRLQILNYEELLSKISEERELLRVSIVKLQNNLCTIVQEREAIQQDYKDKKTRLKGKWNVLKTQMKNLQSETQVIREGILSLQQVYSTNERELKQMQAQFRKYGLKTKQIAESCARMQAQKGNFQGQKTLRALQAKIGLQKKNLLEETQRTNQLIIQNEGLKAKMQVAQQKAGFAKLRHQHLHNNIGLAQVQLRRLEELIRRQILQKGILREKLGEWERVHRGLEAKLKGMQQQVTKGREVSERAGQRRRMLKSQSERQLQRIEEAFKRSRATASRLTYLTSAEQLI